MAFKQYPVIVTSPQMGPGKFPGGYLWGVLFSLPAPAGRNGYIVQEVDITEDGMATGGAAARFASHYWEAWPVSQGKTTVTDASGLMTLAEFIRSLGGTPPASGVSTEFNDFFFHTYSLGNRGTRTMRAAAGFYEDSLPADFVTANTATRAGSLLSTAQRPSFWKDSGLYRYLRFSFDFTTSRDATNAKLQTAVLPTGTIAGNATPDASLLRTL